MLIKKLLFPFNWIKAYFRAWVQLRRFNYWLRNNSTEITPGSIKIDNGVQPISTHEIAIPKMVTISVADLKQNS